MDNYEFLAETACCIWEEMISIRKGEPQLGYPGGYKRDIMAKWEDDGTCSLRLEAVGLAQLCDQVWAMFSPEEQDSWGAFDWEFVPAFVRAHYTLNSRDPDALYRFLTVKHIVDADA